MYYNQRSPYPQDKSRQGAGCDSGCRPNRSLDSGPEPFVVDIDKATVRNNYFRTTIWTGCYLQLTLMCIEPGDDIGIEMHPDVDQFLRIEQGQGMVMMGGGKGELNYRQSVYDGFAIIIPAGTWHNVVNTGRVPLKLYSIYAPPQHPHGTVHITKRDAEHDHHDH